MEELKHPSNSVLLHVVCIVWPTGNEETMINEPYIASLQPRRRRSGLERSPRVTLTPIAERLAVELSLPF